MLSLAVLVKPLDVTNNNPTLVYFRQPIRAARKYQVASVMFIPIQIEFTRFPGKDKSATLSPICLARKVGRMVQIYEYSAILTNCGVVFI